MTTHDCDDDGGETVTRRLTAGRATPPATAMTVVRRARRLISGRRTSAAGRGGGCCSAFGSARVGRTAGGWDGRETRFAQCRTPSFASCVSSLCFPHHPRRVPRRSQLVRLVVRHPRRRSCKVSRKVSARGCRCAFRRCVFREYISVRDRSSNALLLLLPLPRNALGTHVRNARESAAHVSHSRRRRFLAANRSRAFLGARARPNSESSPSARDRRRYNLPRAAA